MSVLFVFVDGVGAGRPDPAVNPLAHRPFLLSRFEDGSGPDLPSGGRAGLADARLGVPGRPQSATGQATILTGENAPALLGKHLLGFPNPRLRTLLQVHSVYRRLAEAGRRAVFANAYPVAYLRALGFDVPGEPEFPLRRRARASATTVAFAAGGGAFRTFDDARAGRGLTHDLTARRAEGLGLRRRLPIRTPEEAAGIFQGLAGGADLAAFEFFETDEAGHARSMSRALDALDRLDRFLRALVAGLGPEDSLVVTSDHGNLEDATTRRHTSNPVPLLAWGAGARETAAAVTRLDQVTPAIVARHTG